MTQPTTPAPALHPYEFCPYCGAAGVQRERRMNGNDKCANGHTYASAEAITAAPAGKPLSEEEILQAVARGWCSAENAHKEMDATLAAAIAKEVVSAIEQCTPPASKPLSDGCYSEGVNIDRLIRAAVLMGLRTEESKEAYLAQSVLADTVNGITRVIEARSTSPAVAELVPSAKIEDMENQLAILKLTLRYIQVQTSVEHIHDTASAALAKYKVEK